MKILVDTTDFLKSFELEILTTKDHGVPTTWWVFLLLQLLEAIWSAIKIITALIPALFYIWLVAAYWPELRGEGLSIWEAGTGLVALYGLALHWWRTSTQAKQYIVDMKKAHREDLKPLGKPKVSARPFSGGTWSPASGWASSVSAQPRRPNPPTSHSLAVDHQYPPPSLA